MLLATHNGRAWIEEQIESIRAQEGVGARILASDDASTDGTYEYLTGDAGVEVLGGRGPYGSAGRNFYELLIRADFSDCDWVAFSDQDDVWYPWKLHRAIARMTAEKCEGYSANVTAFWEDDRELLIDKAQPQKEWDFLFEAAGPGCTYVISSRMAAELQSLLRVRPSIAAEVYNHDSLIYGLARARGFRWLIDPQPVLHYRQHGTNHTGANTGWSALRKRIKLIRSGWYREQAFALAHACELDEVPFVQEVFRPGIRPRLRLALRASQCRRRPRDAVLLAFIALSGWF